MNAKLLDYVGQNTSRNEVELWNKMRNQGIHMDEQSFTRFMHAACSTQGDIAVAKRLYETMKQGKLNFSVTKEHCSTFLTTFHKTCYENALDIGQFMVDKNIQVLICPDSSHWVSWTILPLHLSIQSVCREKGVDFGTKGAHCSCESWSTVGQLYCNCFGQNVLKMWGLGRHTSIDRVCAATKLNLDLFARTALISAVAHSGDLNTAIALFQKMRKDGLKPDNVTWNTLIAGVGRSGNGSTSI